MNGFEGSFLGDAARLHAGSRLECSVCWWIYDPDRGDEVWHVAPGTPFTNLPAHWRCPSCDAAPEQFMLLATDPAARHEVRDRPLPEAGLESLARRSRELEQVYCAVDRRMRELPVYNSRLSVEVTGMRRCEHGLLCVVSTPWSMNLVLCSQDGTAGREGTSRDIDFPSGRYPFISGHLQGIGTIETCSLFSPMDLFDDPEIVRQVAEQALTGLFAGPTETSAATESTPGISRRQFLRPSTGA